MIKATERRLTRELEPLDASGFELSDSWIPRILPAERRLRAICMCSPVEERIQRPPPSVRDCENLKWLFLSGETGGVQKAYCRTTLVYALPNTGIELAVPILKYSMLANTGRTGTRY